MYTLRSIAIDGRIRNISLGFSYDIIDKKMSPANFEDLAKRQKSEDSLFNEEHCSGFIVSAGGDEYPYFDDKKYYIMTDSGKTLERL